MSDNIEAFLAHYGVVGMKWGVHRSSTLTGLGEGTITRTLSNGDKLTLSRKSPGPIDKALATLSSKYAESYNKAAHFKIQDNTGSLVGRASIWKNGSDELYINWIGIKKSSRGKGYATAIVETAKTIGKEQGVKKITLEVPGDSPDARHIYEKQGFKVTGQATSTNDIWGGLTSMEYRYDD